MTTVQALHHYLEASALAFADRGAYVGDPRSSTCPSSALLSDTYAAERACLIDPGQASTKPVAAGDVDVVRRGVPPARARRGRPRADTENVDDHQPHRRRPLGQRRRVHAHHRADRRLRHRRAGPRLPAQQRADRLLRRLRRRGPEPDRARQAPAQLDVPDDRARGRASRSWRVGSPGGSTIITTVLQVLVNRLDLGMTLPQAIAAPAGRAAQHARPITAEPAFIDALRRGARPRSATTWCPTGDTFTGTAEIGAATGIEFGPGKPADRRRRARPPRRRCGGGRSSRGADVRGSMRAPVPWRGERQHLRPHAGPRSTTVDDARSRCSVEPTSGRATRAARRCSTSTGTGWPPRRSACSRRVRRRRPLRRLAQGRPGRAAGARHRRHDHRDRRAAGQQARRRLPQRAEQPPRRAELLHPRPRRHPAHQRPGPAGPRRAVLRRHASSRATARCWRWWSTSRSSSSTARRRSCARGCGSRRPGTPRRTVPRRAVSPATSSPAGMTHRPARRLLRRVELRARALP